MKFAEGQEVLAKHPDSTEYHKGTIMSARGDRYKIQFEGGTKHVVYEDSIQAERSSRSSTRTSGRMSKKSPSRYSPNRRTMTRRSPGRSPARSPARSPTTGNRKKLPVRSTRLAKISLPRIEVPYVSNEKKPALTESALDDSPTELMPLQSRLKEIGTVTRRSARLLSSTLKTEPDHRVFLLPRTIDRAVSLPVERKNQVHDFVDGKERGYSVQRDQDLTNPSLFEEYRQSEPLLTEKRKIEINLINEPQEWGSWIGAFALMCLLPLSIIVPQYLCVKSHCNIAYSAVSSNIKEYINLEALIGYTGFLTILTIASILPIGKCIEGQHTKIGSLKYRINGFFCAGLILIIVSICVYKGIAVSDVILDNSVQLSVSGWILGTILAVVLYIKAGRGPVANFNIHASSKSVIYNFWQGREINPRIGHLDLKIILLRASVIGTLIINTAILLRAMEKVTRINVENVNCTVYLATSLQILYSMDYLIFESNILTSFEILYEGTGYMTCVGHLLYPFLPTLATRFMLEKTKSLTYESGIFVLIFFIGYIIYRLSNSQKHEFRKNTLSPVFACAETIATPRGKKLIASGLWGHVRHPNYLGDIIMQWSISCIGLTADVLLYYAPLCCTLTLMYRATRDNIRCKTRYGYAWEQYCSRVKYMIFKGIF